MGAVEGLVIRVQDPSAAALPSYEALVGDEMTPQEMVQTVKNATATIKKIRKDDPRAGLAKTLSDLEKRLGKGLIHPASTGPPVYHVPFRNPHLNYVSGGGAPWNRYMALLGDPSVGKSLAAYELLANAQGLPDTADVILAPRIAYHRGHGHDVIVNRLEEELAWTHDTFPDGAEGVFYDIEGQFDKRRAQKLGVDTDRLYLAELNVIEDIGITMMELFPYFPIHVLDSTSNATSMLQLKHEPGKSTMGVDARQWKAVLRDANTYFGPPKNTTGIPNMVVMIHQMAMNIQTGGSQQATGKYVRFISSMSLKFTRGGFLWDKNGVLEDGKATGADKESMSGRAEADGVAVVVQCEKSRTCRPFRVGTMQFDYRKLNYTVIHELATSGLYFGLIKQSGSWYSIPGEDGTLGQGLKSVYSRLADDEALRDAIMCRLLDFSADE